MAFALDLSKFIEKAQGNTEMVIRKTGTDMLAKLIDRSPVGNPDVWLSMNPVTDISTGKTSTQGKAPDGYVGGRFRGNWQVAFDSAPGGEVDRVDPDGKSTLAIGKVVLSAYKSGVGSIWLANNVPYSYSLEMGHSSQAPQGMAGITAAEFQTYVNQAVRELDT
ncbi:hypothetical protein [Pseudidiomarina sp.]|uniref:hypothetical protein n=1 Tax=Pseudidiomarina sp. TaxID=2081707 RepID=UPI003A985191